MPLDPIYTMPIISLWQPWATWVAYGWKTIETRTHDRFKNLKGARIGIHASRRWDKTALRAAYEYLDKDKVLASRVFTSSEHPLFMARSVVIASATVQDFRELTEADEKAALIECQSVKRYGLFLVDIVPIPPIQAPGHQGIFYLSHGVLD